MYVLHRVVVRRLEERNRREFRYLLVRCGNSQVQDDASGKDRVYDALGSELHVASVPPPLQKREEGCNSQRQQVIKYALSRQSICGSI